MYSYSIYARLICDVETISGNTTQPIPTDDFVGNNKIILMQSGMM